MGNQNNTKEKEENKSEEIQKEEVPSDTHSNKQNIEDINSQNNQDNQDILNNKENHLIIKEVKFNNNEDEANNQIEMREMEKDIDIWIEKEGIQIIIICKRKKLIL